MKKALALLLVTAILAGFTIMPGGCGSSNPSDSSEDSGGASTSTSSSSSSTSETWYSVYFVPGDDVQGHLIDLVGSAKESLHVAVHELNVEAVTTAFIEAHNRGVDVKFVIEKDYSDPKEHPESAAQYSRLAALGLTKTDDSEALMHNKFVVVDNKTVWTGSTNFTENCLQKNNNNTIVIQSPELAKDYSTEFDEMWNGQFGAKSPANTPYPEVNVSGTTVECYFAPEDDVESQIAAELQQADKSVYFATFTFTSDSVEEALLSKAKAGVAIEGIFESRQKSQYWAYDPLKAAGVPVLLDKNPNTMHHKFFIIDEDTVITGSFNPTSNANKSNDENILIIHNADIAKLYYTEFSRMWQEWNTA
jgi:phosphatidylserine/phosphatidylglycerophosphate/cardiolipin synthase-like enzyme